MRYAFKFIFTGVTCVFNTFFTFAQCTTCTLVNPASLPDPIPAGTTVCITVNKTYGSGANLTGGSIHVCSGAVLRINGEVDMNSHSEITTTGCSTVNVQGNIENPNPIGLKVIDNCNCPNSINVTGSITGYGVVCGPLPVELVSFDAELIHSNEVKLSWTTATELNNNYFLLERSTDMLNWSLVTTVAGAGNSNELKTYTTSDFLNTTGIYYYRLTQVDYDGTSKIFDIRSVTCNSIEPVTAVNLYPNPATDYIMLMMNGSLDTDVQLNILDLSGQVVYSSLIAKGSPKQQRINLEGFGKGVYLVKLTGGSLSQSSKLIIAD